MDENNQVAKYDSATHFYGIGSLVLAGIGVPFMLHIANKQTLSEADRWVLRGVALSSAVVIAPLGYMYLSGLRKN
mgnify:FL=1|tara:strand:+ start:586 stop:810 length:225 start_codon:yes stop_codon:yes gene_type:complete